MTKPPPLPAGGPGAGAVVVRQRAELPAEVAARWLVLVGGCEPCALAADQCPGYAVAVRSRLK